MKALASVLLASVGLAAGAHAEIDEATARRLASNWLKKIGSGLPQGSETRLIAEEIGRDPAEHQLHRWEVGIRGVTVQLEPNRGDPLYYRDLDREGLAMGKGMPRKGVPFFASLEDLAARARSVLSGLGWNSAGDAEFGALPRRDQAGDIPRCVVNVMFYERANGYPTGGNRVGVSFDSITGDLIGVSRSVGFTYSEPAVNLSKAQVAEAAARILGEPVPVDAVTGPQYWYLNGNADLSPNAATLVRRKQLPLSYRIKLPMHTLMISAADGEVLTRMDGGTGLSVPGSPKKGFKSENKEVPWIALGVAAGAVATYWLRRRPKG